MLEFGVESEVVVENVNGSTGEVYRNQWAYFVRDGIRFPFLFGLGKKPPLKVGRYDLDPRCLGTSQYDKLQLNFVSLVPCKLEAAKKAG